MTASVEAIAALVGVDGDDVAFLADAAETDRMALLRAVADAGKERDVELREAVDKALGFVPRPLRGRVLKMLGGGRG